MKQYTSNEQTAKLIELGFEKPKTIVDKYYDFDAEDYKEVNHYSIGELIEMLDNMPNNMWNFTRTSTRVIKVEINGFPVTKKDKHLYKISYNKELIDALYDMVVKLKKEEMI